MHARLFANAFARRRAKKARYRPLAEGVCESVRFMTGHAPRPASHSRMWAQLGAYAVCLLAVCGLLAMLTRPLR